MKTNPPAPSRTETDAVLNTIALSLDLLEGCEMTLEHLTRLRHILHRSLWNVDKYLGIQLIETSDRLQRN